jgi:hypothetical protein
MADTTTQPESAGEQSSQELPVPTLESASQVSSTSSVDTKALAAEVAKLLKPDFEKVAQSTKDKRIAALEKKLGVGDLAELKEMGVEIPEKVEWEYRFRQLETQRQAPEAPGQTPTSQGSGATLTAQDVSEVVKNFNLDANTPEVLEALRGTYRNRDHFEATLARMAMAKTSKPTPSATEATSLAGAANRGSEKSPAALEADYQKELLAISQTRRGDEKLRAIAGLKAKYREAGLSKI